MAIYVLECKKCECEYEIQSMMCDQRESIKKAKCPECKSKSKQQIITSTPFSFSDPVGSDRYNNSHDYRFKHSQDKPGGVRDQRKAAEIDSHVGKHPYNNIDDISSGKHFGEVK